MIPKLEYLEEFVTPLLLSFVIKTKNEGEFLTFSLRLFQSLIVQENKLL